MCIRDRLREMTGAGMMDCKKALTETNGDMDAAVEVLRKSGAAKMEKKPVSYTHLDVYKRQHLKSSVHKSTMLLFLI